MIAVLFASLAAMASEPTVYPALEKAAPRVPLGGSYADGEKMLREADAAAEADAAFESGHAGYLRVCGFACTVVGIESADVDPHAASITVPATSDALSAANKGYNEAAMNFAKAFNVRMHERLASQSQASKPIQGTLTEKELTVNGVTVGKSNLYNATGKFGTNMFKKHDGGFSSVCWKGDDGTLIVFESDKGGGPDQTITRARLLSEPSDYEFASDCKASKKVSAESLELAGVRVGAPLKARTANPTEVSETAQTWKYETEKKNKKLSYDLEIKTGEKSEGSQVKAVSVWRH